MKKKPTTVAEYLAMLTPDRRAAVNTLRAVFRNNLDPGFKEGIQYGCIGYFVPHSIYPAGYHCDPSQPLPFAGLASMKNAISIHMFCLHVDTSARDDFVKAWSASGHRLDMGSGCVRVKSIDDVPLDVLAGTLRRITPAKFIDQYEHMFGQHAMKAARKTPAKRPTSKSPATKPSVKDRSRTAAAPTAARPSAAPAPKRQARARTPRAGRSTPRSPKGR